MYLFGLAVREESAAAGAAPWHPSLLALRPRRVGGQLLLVLLQGWSCPKCPQPSLNPMPPTHMHPHLQMYGWQWGMFAPGIVGTVMGLLILLGVRDSPEASE